ncbi:hypothetical protein pclt_cds_32 [Pandoravirus celtis]|uniref:Uncharacterized protein n=1 Tax=Pandoravirus celtis TaxID=2568002 RepID=A0A4D6EGP2_9VIRU|nr:hypothetical protein pclt_cds_32 [Pandoravirus celtis]
MSVRQMSARASSLWRRRPTTAVTPTSAGMPTVWMTMGGRIMCWWVMAPSKTTLFSLARPRWSHLLRDGLLCDPARPGPRPDRWTLGRPAARLRWAPAHAMGDRCPCISAPLAAPGRGSVDIREAQATLCDQRPPEPVLSFLRSNTTPRRRDAPHTPAGDASTTTTSISIIMTVTGNMMTTR